MFPRKVMRSILFLLLEPHYVDKLMHASGYSNEIGIEISKTEECPKISPFPPRTIESRKYFWVKILQEEGIFLFLT